MNYDSLQTIQEWRCTSLLDNLPSNTIGGLHQWLLFVVKYNKRRVISYKKFKLILLVINLTYRKILISDDFLSVYNLVYIPELVEYILIYVAYFETTTATKKQIIEFTSHCCHQKIKCFYDKINKKLNDISNTGQYVS